MKDFSILKDILSCPDCSAEVSVDENGICCQGCDRTFSVSDGIADMRPATPFPKPKFYDDELYKRVRDTQMEHHSSHYREKSLSRLLEDQFKRRHSRMVRMQPGPIFDIGCGTGSGFAFLGDPSTIVGMDANMDLLEACRIEYPLATLVCGDITKPPFRAKAIKNVFFQAVLEHIFYLDETLRVWSDLIDEDGHAYVLIPNEGTFLWNLAQQFQAVLSNARAAGLSPSDYLKGAKKEHCNTVYAVDCAIRKYFKVNEFDYWPFKPLGASVNLVKLYRLSPL